MNVIVKTSRFLDMFFLAGVASVFLVSCSGGSGGSASAPVQITESDAETDSSEIGIFDNTDTDPTIDDTAGLSTEDQQLVSDDNDSLSIQTDHPLALLFGTNEFAYRFFLDENSTFFLDVTFENIILPTEPTEGILIGIATSRTQLDGSDEILMQDGELILSCSYSTTEQYLCIGLFESGATVNFLIPNLVNGEASGNFEFCGADGQTDCVSELVLSPAPNIPL